MRPFAYARARDAAEASRLGADALQMTAAASKRHFLAGGTTLLDLAKLDVMRPETVVDINPLAERYADVAADRDGLTLGALARMSDAAEDRVVLRDYPVIAQSLQLAASQQIRNMATLGGNVLQRTRCPYFRDVSWKACNKRNPGSGCAAIGGINRRLAVLGVSDACIASYPGDFGQALVALEAVVELTGADGTRTLPFDQLHRLPGSTPHIETELKPGELITAFRVPAGPWTRRSLYLKVRDRASYEFAAASAAVALDIQGGAVRTARIALGGMATRPWRAREAEALLTGRRLDEAAAEAAADAAFAGAVTHQDNAFKPELGRRTLVRALLQAAAMRV